MSIFGWALATIDDTFSTCFEAMTVNSEPFNGGSSCGPETYDFPSSSSSHSYSDPWN